jgi:hypothetical protein
VIYIRKKGDKGWYQGEIRVGGHFSSFSLEKYLISKDF